MWLRTIAALAAAIFFITGCASLPGDRGRSGADALAAERNLPVMGREEADEIAAGLLAHPLGPANAVQVALLRNADLRAEYARLGLAAAEIYEAGRLPNPRLSSSRMDSNEGGALDQVTFGLSQSLAGLLTLGDRSRLAEAELGRAQAQAASAVFDTAVETGRAWYRLAAAKESATVKARIADAAQAAADLGQRFRDAGNLTRLELAELKAEAAEARIESINARAAVDEERSALGRLMGVDAAHPWRIANGLPVPVRPLPNGADLKRRAAGNRLDLLAANRRVENLEQALDVTRRWRWLGDPELELETERETDGSRLTGAGLSLEIPVFNQHADELARGEARLEAAYAMRDAVANRASHQMALALARLEAADDRLAALADGVLPGQRQRVEETQKRVNYMLAGVFELIDTRKMEYRSVADYIGAVRDHWLARLELDRASGRLSPPPEDRERIDAESLLATPPDVSMPGMHHDHDAAATPPDVTTAGEEPNDHDHHDH
jgi:cobalt-zinc-cadmium efflux system outer membrane protein